MCGGPPTGQCDTMLRVAACIRYSADMTMDRTARPNTIPWPPLLYAGGAVAALLLDRAIPLPPWLVLAQLPAVRLLGDVLLVLGVALDLWAMVTMWRQHANILPHRAATALITTGPFALSRNPIYLGNTLLILGAGLAFGIAWLLPMGLLAAALTSHLAIAREEAHLNARFGAAWRDYTGRVPRWFRFRRPRRA